MEAAGMYERFFYLTERPFHITPDPQFLFLGRNHREALDLLKYGIADRRGFVLLTGEVGTGKTTLCRALMERLSPKTKSALILNPVLSDCDLLRAIVTDFGLEPGNESAAALIDRLNRFLLETAAGAGGAVVIVDEAQNLSLETLEMLRMLSNLETKKEKLIQIVLVGQPELDARLRLKELRQLNQRIAVRYSLGPLDAKETAAYIHNRLFIAGGRGAVEFDSAAAMGVYLGSAGVPRAINIICDRALTAAFIEETRHINADIVRKAVTELRAAGCLLGRTETVYERHYASIALCLLAVALIIVTLWGPLEVLR